jgi:ketosteroid isomerase-like protein
MRIHPTRPLLALLIALFASTVPAVPVHAGKPAKTRASPQEANARALFEQFVRLTEAFDPAITDLYADTAKISNRRVFPDGTSREMSMPAPSYKTLLRQVLPVAKEQNDLDRYSEVRYTVEGDKVRITATRYSVMKDYSAPHTLLVGPDTDGTWRILEESGESRP